MKSTLNEDEVKGVFSQYTNGMEVLIGLYKLALPSWDQIEYILEGRPHLGKQGWHAIFALFQELDQVHHANEDIFPGGLWLSNGFELDEGLDAWEVDTSELKLALKGGH